LQIRPQPWIVLAILSFASQLGWAGSAAVEVSEDSLRIRHIAVESRNIFDDSDGKFFLHSLQNRLHAVTSAAIIRNELLFESGDFYIPELLAETERNLRALGFLGKVSIAADTLDLEFVDLTVRTRDKWTLSLHSSYSQEGGVRAYDLGMQEKNLLGQGKLLKFRFSYRNDRRDELGYGLQLIDPRLRGSRWRTELKWKDYEEREQRAFKISHPYFSEDQRWAAGLHVETGSQLLREYAANELVEERSLEGDSMHAWISRSFGRAWKRRVTLAYRRTRIEDERTQTVLRAADHVDLLQLSLLLHSHRFIKRHNLDGGGQTEDIPLGAQIGVSFGSDLAEQPDAAVDFKGGAHAQITQFLSPSWYFGARVGLEGYFGEDESRDLLLHWKQVQHFVLPFAQTLVFQASGIYGRNMYPGWQLQLGSPTGLRGHDAYALQGSRQLLFNLEDRLNPDFRIWIYRLAPVVFADLGTVWSEGQSIAEQRFHGSVGLGLRLSTAKSNGTAVTRLDVAWNPEAGSLSGVIIAGGQQFSAFLDRATLWPFN
jgi:hypothetical protein